MEIRKSKDMRPSPYKDCHDGVGTLVCNSLLEGLGSQTLRFMHNDEIPAGVSIGEHKHTFYEEAYYLISGEGVLLYDGVEYPMEKGDISLCLVGHSHGFKAVTDCVLIVVAGQPLKQ